MPKQGAIYSCSYSYITLAKFKVAKYKVWQGRIPKSPTAKLKNAKYKITTVGE